MRLLTVSFLFFLLTIQFSSFAEQQENRTFPYETVQITGNGSCGPYRAEKSFIAGTLKVTDKSGAKLAVEKYDSINGVFTLEKPIASGETFSATFAPVPSWIKKSYGRRLSIPTRENGSTQSYDAYREKTPENFSGLKFGGSKTFEISTGSQRNASVNQTLQLSITGNLTDDITLNAAVSDQNVPITPEGNTKELSEIDRILIELRGKNFRLDMGDTDLSNKNGKWLSYSRRLSGAEAEVKAGNFTVHGSGAVSDGRYMSTTITPVEGNQGPYRLLTESGQTDISIIPGTERVWINGVKLTRGLNNDYTIDYDTGELRFTENRVIGSESRIVADYEYTSESYRRTFYSSGAEGNFFKNRLIFNITAAREADDSSRPVLYDLDSASKKMLSAAGDSTVYVSGIKTAQDDTSGTYDMVDGHLVYNATKKGEYSAAFSWVGQDKGEYRYNGGGIYEYVESENRVSGSGASYMPVVKLNSPVSHSIAGMTMAIKPVDSVKIESEFASSSLDQNTLSGRDDSDNTGMAYRFNIFADPLIKTKIPLKIGMNASHQYQDEKFSPLDRDRSAEENRRWGLPLVIENDRELITEYSGGVTLAEGKMSGSGFGINSGKAEYGTAATSERKGFSGNFGYGERASSSFSYDDITRKSIESLPDENIGRFSGSFSVKAAGFRPSLTLETEKNEGLGTYTAGSSYKEINTKLEAPALAGVTTDYEWYYRKEQAKRTVWVDSSFVRGGSLGIAAGKGITGQLKSKFSHRERVGKDNGYSTDQIAIDGFYRPEKAAYSFDWTYRAGREREALKRKNYIYVGSGKGSYRWEDYNDDDVRDEDEFIPDEQGEYYLYEEVLDKYESVNSVSAYAKVGLKIPESFVNRVFSRKFPINTETSFEINEKSDMSSADVFLLNISKFRKNGKTLTGNSRIQEDINFPLINSGTARIRLFRYDSYDASYITGAERKNESEGSLRLRIPVRENLDTETTLTRSWYARTMDSISRGNYDVDSYYGETEISVYPVPKLKTGISGGAGFDKDSVSSINATYYVLKPSASWSFSTKGRLSLSYSLTSVKISNPDDMRMAYTMAKGKNEGNNHDISLSCDYRVSQRMDVVSSYTGRRFAGKSFEHYASVQVRALF